MVRSIVKFKLYTDLTTAETQLFSVFPRHKLAAVLREGSIKFNIYAHKSINQFGTLVQDLTTNDAMI